MKLSIIIPALNEERYLPLLLECIGRQTFRDFEVIVADARSTDGTVRIAQEFGAKIVEGGMPARGRNNGARVAQGQFLFFLDADVLIPDDFLQCAYDEMQERYLDLATCEVVPISDLQVDRILHTLANISIRIGQFTNPHAGGFCILCTRRLFDRVNGFDESLTMAEDHDFVKRASRFRPLRVLDSTRINISVRRLEKEGRAVLVNKYLLVELHRLFKGELKDWIFDYEFGNFHDHATKEQSRQLAALESDLLRIDKKLHAAMEKKGPGDSWFDMTAVTKLGESFREHIEKTGKILKQIMGKKG